MLLLVIFHQHTSHIETHRYFDKSTPFFLLFKTFQNIFPHYGKVRTEAWPRPGWGGTSGGMVAHDLVNGWQATAWRDERSEPPEVSPPPGRGQGRHKHHHGYLRSKLTGRGYGIVCNWLIIKYRFNSSVEMQAFFGHVSTPCFITHWKSTLPKTRRSRVPTPDFNVMKCVPAELGTPPKTLTSRAWKGQIYSQHDHFSTRRERKTFYHARRHGKFLCPGERTDRNFAFMI